MLYSGSLWWLWRVVFIPAGIGILLARSWTDGYTFPLDNIYFTWVLLLCAIWLAGIVKNKDGFLSCPSAPVFGLLLFIAATMLFPISTIPTRCSGFGWVMAFISVVQHDG